jgi:fructose-bisphosphate aldolase class 1
MMIEDLKTIAARVVANGKGILAADETVPTLTKRSSRSSSRKC